jgi:hypothetical protein
MRQARSALRTWGLLPFVFYFLGFESNSFFSKKSTEHPTPTYEVATSLMDTIPPVAICTEPSFVNLNTEGLRTLTALAFDDGSYDTQSSQVWYKVRRLHPGPCSSDSLFRSSITFCCAEVGDTVEVILRVYDQPIADSTAVSDTYLLANSDDCIARVAVRDNIKPVVLTAPDVTVTCDEFLLGAVPYPTATDNCGVDTITYTDQLMSFDTACSYGVLRRRFVVSDKMGNTATRTAQVTVLPVQDYFVKFPADTVVVGCEHLQHLEIPEVFNASCERVIISFSDDMRPDSLGMPNGCLLLRRTWSVRNQCTYNPALPYVMVPNPRPEANIAHPANRVGVVVAPSGSMPAPTSVRVLPTDSSPTDYAQFWSDTTNGFRYVQYIWIWDTIRPEGHEVGPDFVCDISANNQSLWSGTEWFEPQTGANDLREGSILPGVMATDACVAGQTHAWYELLLDLDLDDTLETRVRSDLPPPPGSVIFGSLLPSGEVQRIFDKRVVPITQKYIFGLQRQVIGDSVFFQAGWNTLGAPHVFTPLQLPYGRHRIVWHLRDLCGNERLVTQRFGINNDCQEPSLTCLDNLTVQLPASGGDSVVLDPSQLVLSVSDNLTLPADLEYGLEQVPFGTDFPETPQGTPISTLELDCDDLGYRGIRLWVRDYAGNSSTCDALVTVRDSVGRCLDAPPSIQGTATLQNGAIIGDVFFDLQLAPDTVAVASMSNAEFGYYFFNDLNPYDDYAVRPRRSNDDWLNGVTSYDLVLISRHILGLESFTHPHQFVAADVNRSNTITSFDIVTTRRVILGTLPGFTGNTSWRFIPKSFQFPFPTNPLGAPIAERRVLASLSTQVDSIDFWGIKIGDLNFNALPNAEAVADDREAPTVALELELGTPELTEQGQRVALRAHIRLPLSAFQLEATWPDLAVQVFDFEAVGIPAAHAAFRPESATLRVSTDAPQGFEVGTYLLGYLHTTRGEVPAASGRLTPATAFLQAAYTPEGSPRGIGWRAEPDARATRAAIDLDVRPNPFREVAQVSFQLPTAGWAEVQITDLHGRLLYRQAGQWAAGSHVFDWRAEGPTGILLCRLETAQGVTVRRVTRVR